MAYNSELKNGYDSNEFKIPESCRSDDGLYVNSDLYVKYECVDGCTDVNELRALFDQVLSSFLKQESLVMNGFRPFPPKIGDGQEVDLFKLFLTTRRIGNYELVSENNLWEFVARECGLEIELVASLKLVYVKYLKEFDKWLLKGGFKDEKMENVEIGVIEKLDLLSRQLGKSLIDVEIVKFEDGTSGFNQNEGEMKNLGFSRINDDDDEEFSDKRCELSPKVIKKVGFSMVNDEVKRNELSSDNVVKKVILYHDDDDDDDNDSEYDDKQIELSIKNVVSEVLRFTSDNDLMLTTKDDVGDIIVSNNVNNVEKVVNFPKRKREEESLPLLEMLDWVTNAARDPHDRAFETSQRSCKWKNYTSEKLWKQALLARRTLFAELNVDSGNGVYGSQKKTQKMHPSMYEELNNTRSSRRTTSVIPCSSRIKRQRTEPVKLQPGRILEITEPHNQEYNLGPLYQAEVPPWTGVVSDSDPKWLGTQMWPPPDELDRKHKKGIMVIGLGRESSCECVFPGSVECVRFHIAENRLKVKLELGQLFYKWKFNQMGEEISLSWEPEEEKRFKSLVIRARYDLANSNKSRHDIMNMFWRKASSLIPAKLKQNVVSYYFNVFVIRRRSYQNRVSPTEIDSDNDEEEVGSVGDRFGYEKVNGMLLKCSKNLQCTEFES